MNKEEILAKAQTEGKGTDVADLDAQRKGAYLAYIVGIIIILIWDIVEGIRYNHINFGGNMVLFAMPFIAFMVKYIILRKKHELIVSLLYGIGFITCLVLWILQLIEVI